MSISELLNSAKIVTVSAGHEIAILDRAIWEEIVSLLEDVEDAAELRQAREEEDELIPWEQVKAEYLAAHSEADV